MKVLRIAFTPFPRLGSAGCVGITHYFNYLELCKPSRKLPFDAGIHA